MADNNERAKWFLVGASAVSVLFGLATLFPKLRGSRASVSSGATEKKEQTEERAVSLPREIPSSRVVKETWLSTEQLLSAVWDFYDDNADGQLDVHELKPLFQDLWLSYNILLDRKSDAVDASSGELNPIEWALELRKITKVEIDFNSLVVLVMKVAQSDETNSLSKSEYFRVLATPVRSILGITEYSSSSSSSSSSLSDEKVCSLERLLGQYQRVVLFKQWFEHTRNGDGKVGSVNFLATAKEDPRIQAFLDVPPRPHVASPTTVKASASGGKTFRQIIEEIEAKGDQELTWTQFLEFFQNKAQAGRVRHVASDPTAQLERRPTLKGLNLGERAPVIKEPQEGDEDEHRQEF